MAEDLAGIRPPAGQGKGRLIIAPSLLAADPACLGAEARRAEAAGADWLHVDIMDGRFVPNLSFGPAIVAMLRRECALTLDVHLMVERADLFVDPFIRAGADIVTVHAEADHDVGRTLAAIRAQRRRCGLSVKPGTAFEEVVPHLADIDLLLVMTVEPGFGGQALIPATLEKCAQALRIREERGLAFDIQVDGGVLIDNAADCARAGANALVAGTSLFGPGPMDERIVRMRKAAVASAARSPGNS